MDQILLHETDRKSLKEDTMAFISLKPGALLAPVPAVLIGSGANRPEGIRQNIMTAAWVGTACTHPPMFSAAIRPERFSYELIRESGEFTINLTTQAMLRATDYCGVVSGRDQNKWEKARLTPVSAENMMYAPAVAESPLYLGCKVRETLPLGSHTLFIGEAVSMGVDEKLMDQKGALHLERAQLIAYNHGQYTGLTEAIGFFGYSVASEAALKRRRQRR